MRWPRAFLALLGLVSGFVLWRAAFIALYGGHGTLCAAAASGRWVLAAVWVAFIAAHVGLFLWLRRSYRFEGDLPNAGLLRWATLTLAVASGVTTVWTGIPIISETSLRRASISSHFLPITTPGRAVWMVI